MTYISNHTADIAIKARQRAAIDADCAAYIKQRRPVTVAPGYTQTPRALSPQQRIEADVADAGAKLSARRSSDGRHNNRNAKRLKKEIDA
jgi:hypothetical protein